MVLMERQIEEEEAVLVHKAVEIETTRIKAGKAKTHSLDKVLKEASLD